MMRAFTDAPVDPSVVDGLIDLARRAPSAGNSQGMAYVVLEGGDTAAYWDVTLPGERRATFRWSAMVTAPVLVLVLVRPDAWLERYSEPDKVGAGLGADAAAWPIPYWWVDAGMAVEHLLLGVVDAGLGACFFGPFDHEDEVRRSLGIPEEWRTVGTIAMGHPAPDEPGLSARRPRPGLEEVRHRGGW